MADRAAGGLRSLSVLAAFAGVAAVHGPDVDGAVARRGASARGHLEWWATGFEVRHIPGGEMLGAHRAFRPGWRFVTRFVTRSVVLLPVFLPIGPLATAHPRPARGTGIDSARVVIPLEGTSGLTLLRTRARAVSYRGRKAVELTEDPAAADSQSLDEVALLDRPELTDGTVEVWVAGTRGAGAAATDRGFIGVVFRSASDGSRFENMYLRPTNGRAEDQLRRNHSTQYASLPDYPWYRLRAETPGKYESYVDLVPGEWTHIRIVVSGPRAALFVNDAARPCLVVTDLKMTAPEGRIGLWIGHGTRGYFSRMVVTTGRGE
jgi:hypothetical protein